MARPSPPPAAIVGVSAVSAFGFDWRGFGPALLNGSLRPRPSAQLARSHPGTLASEVPPVPAARDVADAKSRRLMSRSAHLAAIAMRLALEEAGWSAGRDEIGCFLGIGASGGPMEELGAILRASVVDGRLDPARFCREGLAAAHPLLAFHLLGNFTLCHGSIVAGLGGPNRAFYSRGAGTVTALAEALWSLHEGDCSRVLAGGADSGLHLATFVELALEAFVRQGFVPGEGAALLALASTAERPLAWLEAATTDPDSVEESCNGADLLVLVPWGPPARETLLRLARRASTAPRLDLSESLGDPLAANVGLGCAAAVGFLQAGTARRATVLVAGVDGALGAVRLAAEARS